MTYNIGPCIYCGNEDMAFWDYSTLNPLNEGYSVFCPVCIARGPKMPTKEEAVKAYNRRTVA